MCTYSRSCASKGVSKTRHMYLLTVTCNKINELTCSIRNISLICNAWQADYTDTYFAMTEHSIKEHAPGEWTLEHTLLGFTSMICSHNGTHLGKMLFSIVNQLHIVHKVSSLTCAC